MHTAQLYESSEEYCKTNGVACSQNCFAPPRYARPYTFRTTRELIDSFGCKVLDHAPYRPDLAPSDFHFFWYLKHSLGGNLSSDNEEVKAVENSWLSNLAADFFEEGFQNLFLRYDKCINKLGN
ncbi:histone-lysine N-methyltransferase SETMAR [Trichonephila clavipes]|uniref:Histone-lysine N-methyltransferase SETMAR n=1 Tax=Trichonephila clavipes TaxID=2585209 RepID=A0A8X6R922_TRICX|nr:histone-lysine N-methyltransferase SETMAR [Trichonephila clavipes]